MSDDVPDDRDPHDPYVDAPQCDCPPDAHGEHCTFHPDQVAGPGEPTLSAQDEYLNRMRFAASALLMDGPQRKLTDEELALFIKGAKALAEMFLEMDQKLSTGAASPTAWQMDRELLVDINNVPSSVMMKDIQATLELKVMNLVNTFDKMGRKTGSRLALALGEIMTLNGRLTSEAVHVAVAHRVQTTGGAPELVVKGAHREEPPTPIGTVTSRRQRAVDQED